jgi:hypothetical protein
MGKMCLQLMILSENLAQNLNSSRAFTDTAKDLPSLHTSVCKNVDKKRGREPSLFLFPILIAGF